MLNLENESVVVKKSKNGRGVFAKRSFLPEENILEIKGVFLTCDKDDELDEETRNNTYRYDQDLFISPGKTIANFFNHSCVPNAKLFKKNKKLFLGAINKIEKGEEILFDYSTTLASDDIWQMECNCGEKSCRGIIKKFKSLSLKLKKRYINEKIVPDYILKI